MYGGCFKPVTLRFAPSRFSPGMKGLANLRVSTATSNSDNSALSPRRRHEWPQSGEPTRMIVIFGAASGHVARDGHLLNLHRTRYGFAPDERNTLRYESPHILSATAPGSSASR